MVEVLITGDFCPVGRIDDIIHNSQYHHIYNDLLPLIRKADLAITNLECPVLKGGFAIEKVGPALKAPIESIDALKYGGFGMVTLSNNHIMDYGVDGLRSTIHALQGNDIDYVGAGEKLENAEIPHYKNIKGVKIAFVNISENEFSAAQNNQPGANPINPISNFRQIKLAVENSDHTIVIVHGGNEHYKLPSPNMQELCRFFIDAGASVVVGHHPHCYSGYEIYNGSPIFYSLGNFCFDWEGRLNEDWNFGFMCSLNITKNKVNFELIPYKQNTKQVGLFLLDKAEKKLFFEDIAQLNAIISNHEQLAEKFDLFAKERKDLYLSFVEPYPLDILKGLRRKKMLPSLITKGYKNLLLNIVRCESHRELLIKSLSKLK